MMPKLERYTLEDLARSYAPLSNTGVGEKGSMSNPYTESEMDKMIDEGTWTGGFVIGLGYVAPEVTVKPTSCASDWHCPNCGLPYPTDGSMKCSNCGTALPNHSGSSSSGGGGETSGDTPFEPSSSFNINLATSTLRSKALSTSSGKCAKFVRLAIEAGGLSTEGHPESACGYDTFLQSIGFSSVNHSGYSPQKGDIVVFEAIKGHPHGHIAMYDGKNWISDFVQRDMYGGPAYRNNKDTVYTLLRCPQ